MDITQRQNLFVLWKESFSVVNRAAPKLIAVVLFFGLLLGAAGFGLAILAKPLFLAGNWIALMGIGGLVGLFSFAFMFYMLNVFWRIVGGTAETALFSLPEVFAASVKPTIFCIIAQILWLLVTGAVNFATSFIDNAFITLIVSLAFFFGVAIRIMYAFPAIALKGQGPIDGFVYSWKLTGKNYVDTILMCLTNALFPLTALVFVGVCGYALYVGIPLYFADSFDITHLTWPWWIVLGLICCGVIFIWVAMFTFPIIVFLNRDYSDTPYADDINIRQDAELRPLTSEPIQSKPQPQHLEPVSFERAPSPDIGPAQVKLSRPAVQSNKPLPPIRKSDNDAAEIDLDLLQATFRTEQKQEQVHEQLQEVYQPKKEDEKVIEYEEEDRMPTIVFDEQMTRQLEENRKFWQNEANKEPAKKLPPEDNGAIRMSK